ncbi:MAG: acylphosphatase [Candidatus Thiodiazotropha sp.]|jgi:acylphosphatase
MSEGTVQNQVCIHCYVAGRVQGVFFRASTKYEAQRLGLKGYAKNLHDGRVEVVACGPVGAVDELREWLRKGPANARVSGISCEVMDYQIFTQFTVS